MKIIRFILAMLFLAFAAGLVFFFWPIDPCENVIKYSVGRFDKNFALDQNEFISAMKTAETVWEQSLGRDLFQYEPEARFTVNLIYDERQRETLLRKRTESGLDKAEEVFQNIENAFNILKKQYEIEEAAFNKAKDFYENERALYEKQVAYWNKKGGAPEPKYSELNAKANELNTLLNELNKDASKLNNLQSEFQTALAERNKAASEYNKVVEAFNQKYGHGYEFDQAEYVNERTSLFSLGSGADKQINIYQYSTKNDLVLALAHELGHALGMGHVENSTSIMYYQSNENSEYELRLSAEDMREFERVCKITAL